MTSGTCATPLLGTTIGATKSCTITGLEDATLYQVQLVPYSGTLGSGVIFKPLSNIASATTGEAPAETTRTTLWDPVYNALNLVSNAVRATVMNDAISQETYNGVSMPADSWVQATIKTIAQSGSSGGWGWVSTRCSAPPTMTCYQATFSKNAGGFNPQFTTAIEEKVNGSTVSPLASENATTWAETDTIAPEVTEITGGVTLAVYRNGSGSALLSTADISSPLASGGRAAIGTYVYLGAVGDVELDDVHGDGFTTAATAETCGCDNH